MIGGDQARHRAFCLFNLTTNPPLYAIDTMLSLPSLLTLLALPIISTAHPTTPPTDPIQPPLIIWHGLGDSFERDGLQDVAALAESTNPGTYVHLIRLGESGGADQRATFVGNVTEQVSEVCAQVSADPILRTAPYVNALGFSQGGQFLRGYVERCNAPRVRNLVTFGSQHNGITEFQACGTWDWVCRGAEAVLGAGKWSALAQGRFVPAQYFRDPADMEGYLSNSNFLADINNERAAKNGTYRENMKGLNRLAMYMFEEDSMVHPKETAWFAEVNGTSGKVTPLDDRPLYKEDWLGLKTLGQLGRLDFLTAPGDHMQLSQELLEDAFRRYFGPVEHDAPQGRDRALINQPGY